MTRRLIALAIVLAVSTLSAQAPLVFKDAKLFVQQGDKQKDFDATLTYGGDALTIGVKDKNQKPRAIAYGDVKSAEYTFGKSPRVSAALLVSPLFLFSSSKSHWLTIKTGDDFALLRLDKSNYKLIIAELEKRSHITVASVGENK